MSEEIESVFRIGGRKFQPTKIGGRSSRVRHFFTLLGDVHIGLAALSGNCDESSAGFIPVPGVPAEQDIALTSAALGRLYCNPLTLRTLKVEADFPLPFRLDSKELRVRGTPYRVGENRENWSCDILRLLLLAGHGRRQQQRCQERRCNRLESAMIYSMQNCQKLFPGNFYSGDVHGFCC